MKYFIALFLISIFFFADMITITKQTSGECDMDDESGFCTTNQVHSYLAMYGIMVRASFDKHLTNIFKGFMGIGAIFQMKF